MAIRIRLLIFLVRAQNTIGIEQLSKARRLVEKPDFYIKGLGGQNIRMLKAKPFALLNGH
jgi:hypothetical protein